MTKRLKTKRNIMGFLSVLSTWGPALAWTIISFFTASGGATIAIGATAMIAIGLTIFSAMFKKNFRTPTMIIMLALYFAVKSFMPVILSVCGGIILDELVFTPLYAHYREKASINAEIDKRM